MTKWKNIFFNDCFFSKKEDLQIDNDFNYGKDFCLTHSENHQNLKFKVPKTFVKIKRTDNYKPRKNSTFLRL